MADTNDNSEAFLTSGDPLSSQDLDDASTQNSEAVIVFSDGTDENYAVLPDQISLDDVEGDTEVSIPSEGITIVVTPENRQQVSDLLLALQGRVAGENANPLSDDQVQVEFLDRQRDSDILQEAMSSVVEFQDPPPPAPVKRKRGRPRKDQQTPKVSTTDAEWVPESTGDPLVEPNGHGITLRSARIGKKMQDGGIKKLWLMEDENEDAVDEKEEEIVEAVETVPEEEETVIDPLAEPDTKCKECGEMFETLEALRAHRLELHKRSYNCEICADGFDDQKSFFSHLKTHYEPQARRRGRPRKDATVAKPEVPSPKKEENSEASGPTICEICLKSFRNLKAQQAHMRNFHPEKAKTYHCAQCNTSFRLKEALDTHVENVHGKEEEPVLADEDEEDDKDETVSLVKLQAEEEEDDHDIEFDSNEEEEEMLENELADIPGGPSKDHNPTIDGHCCKVCGAVYSSKKRLFHHLRDDHQAAPARRGRKPKQPAFKQTELGYHCPVCDRIFAHKNSLGYHIRTHGGDRTHMCEICGKSFFANGALKVHMRVHSGARPYKCQACGREFRQWGDLKYHYTSIHSGVRQYQCEFCGKDFARKYSLIVHRRVHTNERNYKCDFCGKGFRASSYLLNHRRIHTGEKPHTCPVCNKAFRMRSDMKRHMQMHSRDGSEPALLLNCSDSESTDPVKRQLTILKGRKGKVAQSSVEAAVATLHEEVDEDGSVMFTIIPSEDMVAVENDKVDEEDKGDEQVGEVHLVEENGEVTYDRDGLEAVTVRDPNTNTLYVWSVVANPDGS